MQLEVDAALQPAALSSEDDASFELVSVLHGRLAEVYAAIPEELFKISEFELCTQVQPTPTDYKMRKNFSDAVEKARAKGDQLRVTSIYEDVISRQTFFNWYVTNPVRMAFIFRPVVTHIQYYDALFKEALRKMYRYVASNEVDAKTLGQFMNIAKMAGDRVIGPVVQRMAVHSKQEITQTTGERSIDVTPENPAELEAKIRELQARQSAIKPARIEPNADIIEDES